MYFPQYALVHVLTLVLAYFTIQKYLKNSKRLQIPRIGKKPGTVAARADFLKNGHRLIEQGYHRFKESAFVIQTADMERVVLSNKYLEELRALPEDELSLRIAMAERHLGRYTTLDMIKESHLQNAICRVQLTQNLGRSMESMHDEVQYALERELGTCAIGSWSSYNGYRVFLNVVSRSIARVFVGLPLCRNQEWLETSVGYTQEVFQVAAALRDRHWILRPILYPFLASRKRLKHRLRVAESHIFPLIQSRLEGGVDEAPSDLLQWMINAAEGADRAPAKHVQKLLFLCMASIHTSTATLCHALFDLCAMPTLVGPLREEILGAMHEGQGLTLAAINSMPLLDSFLKESQRLNHPGSLSFNRKVLKDRTLSDGTFLPAGTFITMPTAAIARDPAYYPDPDDFRPWRFAQLRRSSRTEATRHQFTSTSPSNLAFGHGRFSCPGRFFAAAQIKLVLARLLVDFEMAYPESPEMQGPESSESSEGPEGPEGQTQTQTQGNRQAQGQQRPPNLYIDERIVPDQRQVIRFRRRLG